MSMDMKDLGEFGLIRRIAEDTIADSQSVVAGIGDDAAVLVPTPGFLQLAAADMLVEGVHFDLSFIAAYQLGYKSLAVNLSDIAAMGGTPKHALVSIALPKSTSVEFVLEFYRGMKALAHRHHVNIVGGDTVSSPSGIVVNVTVLGEVEPTRVKKRGAASPGELVAVTGTLGDSAAGLAWLQGGGERTSFSGALTRAHLTPQPQVEAGLCLAGYASAMNDISDGLASEAGEIAEASGVGICIEEAALPLSAEVLTASERLGASAADFALYGGEDYQLVFTISRERYEALCEAGCPAHIAVVGRTETEPGVRLARLDGRIVKLEPKGYNHFR